MNNTSIISGLICLLIGIFSLIYVEKLRKNDELDVINFKGYIGAITLIICGVYLLVNEFLKI